MTTRWWLNSNQINRCTICRILLRATKRKQPGHPTRPPKFLLHPALFTMKLMMIKRTLRLQIRKSLRLSRKFVSHDRISVRCEWADISKWISLLNFVLTRLDFWLDWNRSRWYGPYLIIWARRVIIWINLSWNLMIPETKREPSRKARPVWKICTESAPDDQLRERAQAEPYDWYANRHYPKHKKKRCHPICIPN